MPELKDLASIETLIEDAKQGRMFILVDDEQRENEGDLVIPAECANAEVVNFMATHARGLICLPMEKAHIERLGLPPMARHNSARHHTAFTVSIEAREGVTTGISAADRAQTIAVASNPQCRAEEIATPGHVFPLEAREGGVLVRAGHTEAAVDIARLAGMTPAAVICEIMNEDGTMARLPDLQDFAKKHGLHIGSIADLIAYRRQKEQLVKRTSSTSFTSRYGGEFMLHLYVNTLEYAEHIALVKGKIDPEKPVLVRMHGLNVLDDVLGQDDSPRATILQRAMEAIAKEEAGVVVLLREPMRDSLSRTVARQLAPKSQQKKPAPMLRDYGIGAQILRDLGVKKMVLLTDKEPSIVALEGYDLRIEGHRPVGGIS